MNIIILGSGGCVSTPKACGDYRELERVLNLIHFAYDGLKIQL